MKVSKALSFASLLVAATTGAAFAGPEVTITLKNNSGGTAEYDVVGSNPYTYGQADPKPPVRIGAGATEFFKIKGHTPDVTVAIFQYKMGDKVCRFKTSYIKLPGRSGGPKWTKSADATGGARCEVKVTALSQSTHNWSVLFTMN